MQTQGRRIVFISAAKQSWGAEQSMFSLAREASTAGCAVELICFRGTIEADWEAAAGSPATPVSPAPGMAMSKLHENRLLWAAYLRIHRRNDRVVLFTYHLSVMAGLCRVLLLGRNVHFTLDLHDNLSGRKGQTLLRLAAAGLDTAVACSSYTARQLHGARCKVVAIHGPAEPLAVVSPRRGDARTILIAGRIIAEKRHDLVAEAVARVQDGSIMVLRGSGDGSALDIADSVRRLCSAKLGERFRDDGKVAPERVLDGIDVLVVANDTEPMGRTVLEAQLSGIPVVVPNAGGSCELVEDGVTGLHFAAGDARSLAAVLRQMQLDPNAVAAMVAHARVRAADTVTPEKYARRYLSALVR